MKKRELIANLFEACNNGKSFTQLHSEIVKTGLIRDTFIATKLNEVYCKYTPLSSARKLFDETPHRTVHIWNSILKSYYRQKQYAETMILFSHMVSSEKPDNFTIPIAVKACAGLRAVEFGKMIHAFVKKNYMIDSNMFVGSALIELYTKCELMDDALRVFEDFEFSRPDTVLCTTMVSGYEQNGDPEEALAFFTRMVMVERLSPDPVTLVSVVSACTQLLDRKAGSSVHGFSIRRGFDTGLSLVNALLNFYAKTGSVNAAANLFKKMGRKDVISWSSMIACYAHNGAAPEALEIFKEMIDLGFEPNSVTTINVLRACELTCNLEEGKKIHELAAQKGFEMDVLVSTALIEMYMKCSSPKEAVDLFEQMPRKDVVSWISLLGGYVQNGMAYMAMGLFREMLSNEIQPDSIAMAKILTACSELGILQQAFCLHGYVVTCGFNNNNAFIRASLIELYSKCGSLGDAVKVFEGTSDRDIVIWSSMIAGYGIHGRGEEALQLFDRMVNISAVRPNNVTFLSVLSACSHAGLVREGIELFDMMVHEYQLNPDSKHYGIMVDLLGRTGELDKAMSIIDQMPVPAGPHVWGALLGACRIYQNIKMGELAASNLFQLHPNHAGYYILLSNIYAVDGKWDDAAKIRTLIKGKRLKKIFGQSVVEVKSEVHSFVASDRIHPDSEQIYGLLRNLEVKMREEGYVPDANFLLHETDAIA
ncbi:putative pentatricopeptide repeat-containing protein At3g01580 [Cornus florida]|uniref:putative pentatricopeptide repeat-containing protein At3g01580 n=1 Tax=Cornus florida TaxID=4283 RepID=UPI0028A23195|nr:putative pentatricopeptide repeat-containing protein At3g01580 [Cornus florida]